MTKGKGIPLLFHYCISLQRICVLSSFGSCSCPVVSGAPRIIMHDVHSCHVRCAGCCADPHVGRILIANDRLVADVALPYRSTSLPFRRRSQIGSTIVQPAYHLWTVHSGPPESLLSAGLFEFVSSDILDSMSCEITGMDERISPTYGTGAITDFTLLPSQNG